MDGNINAASRANDRSALRNAGYGRALLIDLIAFDFTTADRPKKSARQLSAEEESLTGYLVMNYWKVKGVSPEPGPLSSVQ